MLPYVLYATFIVHPSCRRMRPDACAMLQSQPKQQFLPKKMSDRYFRMDEVIGHGSFGVVYKGLDIKTSQIVAIKMMPWDCGSTQRELAVSSFLVAPSLSMAYNPKAYIQGGWGGELVRGYVGQETLVFPKGAQLSPARLPVPSLPHHR